MHALDVYFLPEYGKINELLLSGTTETFVWRSAEVTVQSSFLRRPLPFPIDETQYYDIITPYGYGGPVWEGALSESAVLRYLEAFDDYCKEKHIISEFVRFHPLIDNASAFSSMYDVQLNRKTIALDLRDENFVNSQFTGKCRNSIRHAERLGVTVQVDEKFQTIDTFIELYHLTMTKDEADAFYFFPGEYYLGLRELLGDGLVLINARLEEWVIASALFMRSGPYMHYHLSATHPDYYRYAANNAILFSAASWGRAHGCEWLHLGGGLSADEEDALFRFKHAFGRKPENEKYFYIARKVWNESVFRRACELSGCAGDEPFFPPYRGKSALVKGT